MGFFANGTNMGPKADQKAIKASKRPAKTVEKKVGGEKNGGTRKVRVSRMPRFYPTEDRPHKLRSRKQSFKQHKRHLRSSITPGTVLILLAGLHKGKRVVFLKQLSSGLLLVTGPFKINGCPMRRINQIYVIATQAKIDIKDVKIPDNVNDEYFKRQPLKKPKHGEGDIFETAEKYTVSDTRKADQKSIDKQLVGAICKNPEKKLLIDYLGTMFSLKNHQYPHKMVF